MIDDFFLPHILYFLDLSSAKSVSFRGKYTYDMGLRTVDVYRVWESSGAMHLPSNDMSLRWWAFPSGKQKM